MPFQQVQAPFKAVWRQAGEWDGKYLPEPLPVGETFITDVSSDDVRPERKFRFTNKCVESDCSQWIGKGRRVIEQVVKHFEHIPEK